MRIGRHLARRDGPARWPTPRSCACRRRCWICAGPLPIVTVAICSSGTIMLLPATAIGRRSMLLASTRSSGCRRTATSRVSPIGIDPVADLDAGEGHAQRLRGVVHRDAELVGEAAVELDLAARPCGSCSDRPDVDRARHLRAACP